MSRKQALLARHRRNKRRVLLAGLVLYGMTMLAARRIA